VKGDGVGRQKTQTPDASITGHRANQGAIRRYEKKRTRKLNAYQIAMVSHPDFTEKAVCYMGFLISDCDNVDLN
jgi:hypothetical protein